jgi:hypothetical protein
MFSVALRAKWNLGVSVKVSRPWIFFA